MINRLWRVIRGFWNSIFSSSHERVLRRYQSELEAWDRLASSASIPIRQEFKDKSLPRYRWVKTGTLPRYRLLDCESDIYIDYFYKSDRHVYTCGVKQYRTKEGAAIALLESNDINAEQVEPL